MMNRAGIATERTREELVMVRSDKRSAEREALWAVLLEEGKDRRLGSRARLRETLDRIGRLVPPERTLAVGIESHARDEEGPVRGEAGPHVLDQPEDRGTGTAALLAALWIEAREPRATVVFLPSGDVIGEERGGMARLAEMADFVERQPEWMILLGVQPRESDMGHGWIEPGQRVGWSGPSAVCGIRRFHGEPSHDLAEAPWASGCLRNTCVWAARPGAVLAAGRECVPSVYEHLVRLSAFWGGEHERWALRHAYALVPTVDFSRAVLETCSLPLAVLKTSAT